MHIMMKNLQGRISAIAKILTVTLLTVPLAVFAEENPATKTTVTLPFVPEFHGVVRGRYELNTEDGYSRFQVRNARLSAKATIARIFTAFIQTDFCDAGSIKILDAYGAVQVSNTVNVRVGQFRMPFGDDSFLAPATYIFANRSFIGKNMCNVRAVGAQAAWTAPTVPLTLSAGVFNPYAITDHKKWTKTYAFSGKALLKAGDWRFTTGFMSLEPDSVRTNLINASVAWTNGRLLLDGEYMYKHYTNRAHKASHGYLVYADYRHPISSQTFNRWSVQVRADGMTAHSDARRAEDGMIHTTEPLRNRLTFGATVSHIGAGGLNAHIRLNYEKYFYGHDRPSGSNAGDKLLAELVISF